MRRARAVVWLCAGIYHMNGNMAVIAAGHAETAEAAAQALAAGGNAFDAAVAAWCAACVAEPVLASLGGGGFLLAKRAGSAPVIYDFFVHTPRHRRAVADTDLRPVAVDFGDAVQVFHIGLGAMATPGAIAGLFEVHRTLCRLPLADLIAPACAMARDGIPQNAFQHRIASIVLPILRAHPAAFSPHASPSRPGELAAPGEILRQPELAASLERLASEGGRLLYDGPWGERLAADCAAGGGHLTEADLSAYRVVRRAPLTGTYRDTCIHTNPPPALGGALILYTLRLLGQARLDVMGAGSAAHLDALARAMTLTQRLRREGRGDPSADPVAEELAALMAGPRFMRGTTQISVADRTGNLASLTLSNGEGAGYVLPGTGIVMNNMLGEEDINPEGFHGWPEDRRMGSMMSPTLMACADGRWIVTGSSGSNRIRSAILQVLVNLVDFGLPLEAAVAAPRLHFEDDLLSLEPPVAADVLAELQARWQVRLWNAPSVFFGGAHSVARTADGTLAGAGDPRRGGVVRFA